MGLLAYGLGAPGAEEMVQLSGNHPTGIVGEPTGEIAPDRMLKMTVTLKLRDPEALNRLLSEQQEPGSPNFQKMANPTGIFGAVRTRPGAIQGGPRLADRQ